MKYRVHMWLDTKVMEPLFGIQAQIAKGVWSHCAKNGKPVMFADEDVAKAYCKKLNTKMKKEVSK